MIKIGLTDLMMVQEPIEECVLSWAEERKIPRDDAHADILFYACGGFQHGRSKAMVKVNLVMENLFPNFNVCDYAISHVRDSIGGRNLYFPYAIESLRTKIEPPLIKPSDAQRRFGIFIASQDVLGTGAVLRRKFTEYLIKNYKQVDCPGRILHNIDIPELGERFGNRWNELKRAVISRYKFLITFENSSTNGYITEKLVDAFVSNTVPIYWGSEGNLDPFPREAIICANDYPDFDSLLARIKEVDENDELYFSILNANPLRKPEFWDMVSDFYKRRTQFLDSIYENALAYKEKRKIKPDLGIAFLDLSRRIFDVSDKGCAALRYNSRTPFQNWWSETSHLYFMRPWKKQKNIICPFRELLEYRSRQEDSTANKN